MSRVSCLMSLTVAATPTVPRVLRQPILSKAKAVGGRGLLSFDQINNAMVSSNLAHRAPISLRCIAGRCALTRNSTDIRKARMISVTTNNTPVVGDGSSEMASAVVVVCPSAIHRTNPAAEVCTNRYSSCKLRRTSLREKPCQESWQQERKKAIHSSNTQPRHTGEVKTHTHILPRVSLLLLVQPTT